MPQFPRDANGLPIVPRNVADALRRYAAGSYSGDGPLPWDGGRQDDGRTCGTHNLVYYTEHCAFCIRDVERARAKKQARPVPMPRGNLRELEDAIRERKAKRVRVEGGWDWYADFLPC